MPELHHSSQIQLSFEPYHMQRIPNKANEYLYNRLFVDLEWEKMKYREENSLPNEGHQL